MARPLVDKTASVVKSGARPPLSGELGAKLRRTRKQKQLSLSEVAAATGISASFLSLVENGKSDITIGRLTRLINFYRISVTDLLPPAEVADATIVRRDARPMLASNAEGIDFALLTGDTNHAMLPMVVSFDPGAELFEFSSHEGEEFVHVLEGSLVLELQGAEPRVLETGDSAYYRADRPHLFRNGSDSEPLTIVCVNSPPVL